MRLLHTTSLQLEHFPDQHCVPEYAILSHTWGTEEITFQDVIEDRGGKPVGWAKLKSCCQLVAAQGWQYVWVDTCCIDKSSSAELSEAINSMFSYYASAEICYAYLEDVQGPGSQQQQTERHVFEQQFISSRWFTRGWTLQEMLAPSYLLFVDRDWEVIGPRSDYLEEIEHVTSISPANMINYNSCTAAAKFSWASQRLTTRVEDQAYCLLGLFGINMPLLYGEGQNAFTRLQLEIIRNSDDESLFVWSDLDGHLRGSSNLRPLFAPSPKCFQGMSSVSLLRYDIDRPEFSMTNKGLSMELVLYQSAEAGNTFLAPLNCTYENKARESPMAIRLTQTDRDNNSFERQGCKISYDRAGTDSREWELVGRRRIFLEHYQNRSDVESGAQEIDFVVEFTYSDQCRVDFPFRFHIETELDSEWRVDRWKSAFYTRTATSPPDCPCLDKPSKVVLRHGQVLSCDVRRPSRTLGWMLSGVDLVIVPPLPGGKHLDAGLHQGTRNSPFYDLNPAQWVAVFRSSVDGVMKRSLAIHNEKFDLKVSVTPRPSRPHPACNLHFSLLRPSKHVLVHVEARNVVIYPK